MRYTITGRNIDVTPGLRAAIEEKDWKTGTLLPSGYRNHRNAQCTERQTENRSYHPGEGKYHPCGRIQQRYVRVH